MLITAQLFANKAGEDGSYGNPFNCCVSKREMFRNISKQANEENVCAILVLNCQCPCHLAVTKLNQMKRLFCGQDFFKNTVKIDERERSFHVLSSFYEGLIKTYIRQDKVKEALFVAERARSRALSELMLNSYSVQPSELLGGTFADICQIQEVVAGVDDTVLFLSLDGSETFFWVIQPSGDVEFKKHSHGLNKSELNWLISNVCMTQDVPYKVECEDRSLANLYPDELVKEPKSVFEFTATSEDVFVTKTEDFPYFCTHFLIAEEGSYTDQRRIAYDEEETEDQLNHLYQLFLKPVRELIKGSQVVIVPEGKLTLVPYAALKNDTGQYVAESLQVRLVPSLATAKFISVYPQQPESGVSPLIIGDPDSGIIPRLPFAHKEALVIGAILNVCPLTGGKATKDEVLQCLGSANLIHIAAPGDMTRGEILLAPNHGNDRRNAKRSKEDHKLVVSDLERKQLRAKLVVLSCCHSGRGVVESEGVIGIAHAFLGAGAHSVLVALWAIDDEATIFFMESFYNHLKCGKKTNESLSLAMKTMRETERFCEPRHWAPFVLIGDNVTVF